MPSNRLVIVYRAHHDRSSLFSLVFLFLYLKKCTHIFFPFVFFSLSLLILINLWTKERGERERERERIQKNFRRARRTGERMWPSQTVRIAGPPAIPPAPGPVCWTWRVCVVVSLALSVCVCVCVLCLSRVDTANLSPTGWNLKRIVQTENKRSENIENQLRIIGNYLTLQVGCWIYASVVPSALFWALFLNLPKQIINEK